MIIYLIEIFNLYFFVWNGKIINYLGEIVLFFIKYI